MCLWRTGGEDLADAWALGEQHPGSRGSAVWPWTAASWCLRGLLLPGLTSSPCSRTTNWCFYMRPSTEEEGSVPSDLVKGTFAVCTPCHISHVFRVPVFYVILFLLIDVLHCYFARSICKHLLCKIRPVKYYSLSAWIYG